MNDQFMTMLRQSSTLAPELIFLRFGDATSAVMSRQLHVYLGLQQKYRQLGAISEIMRSQVLSPITDIFYGNPRLDCRENTAEVASPSLKKLSSGDNVKDYHAQNDRMGPFQPDIILIKYYITLEYITSTR